MASPRLLVATVVVLAMVAVWSVAVLGQSLSLSTPAFVASLLWGSSFAQSTAASTAPSTLLCPHCPLCPTAAAAACPVSQPTLCPTPSSPTSPCSSPSSTFSVQNASGHMSSSFDSFPRLVTIVTAFFPPGKSSADRAKHHMDQYHEWFSNFFTHSFHNAPLYVYTSPTFYPALAYLRYRNVFRDLVKDDFTLATLNNLTAIAARRQLNPGFDLNELLSGRQMAAHFDITWSNPLDTPVMQPIHTALHERQPQLDAYRAIHSPHLYAVWNNKPFFVNRSASLNLFHTRYFMWMDAGSFRNESWRMPLWPNERRWRFVFEHEETLFLHRQIKRWDLWEKEMDPHYRLNMSIAANRHRGALPDGSGKALILYGALGRLPFDGLLIDRRHYCDANYTVVAPGLLSGEKPIWVKAEANTEFVQGTFWAGNAESVAWYSRMYYDTIYGYAERDWFMGDEQHVMTPIAIAYARQIRFYHVYQFPTSNGDPWFSLPIFFADAQVVREKFWDLPPHLLQVDGMISDASAQCFD